jgi:hypothetical protein
LILGDRGGGSYLELGLGASLAHNGCILKPFLLYIGRNNLAGKKFTIRVVALEASETDKKRLPWIGQPL